MDDNTFAQLLLSFEKKVLGFLQRIRVPDFDRDDIWQQVCFDSLKRFRSGSLKLNEPLLPFLFSLANRRAIDRRRLIKRTEGQREIDVMDPIKNASERSVGSLLSEMLSLIFPEDREILRLMSRRMSSREIASELNMTLKRVRIRMNRIRNTLCKYGLN